MHFRQFEEENPHQFGGIIYSPSAASSDHPRVYEVDTQSHRILYPPDPSPAVKAFTEYPIFDITAEALKHIIPTVGFIYAADGRWAMTCFAFEKRVSQPCI